MSSIMRSIKRLLSRRKHNTAARSSHDGKVDRSLEAAAPPAPSPPSTTPVPPFEEPRRVNGGDGPSDEPDQPDKDESIGDHAPPDEISQFLDRSFPARSSRHHGAEHPSKDQQAMDEWYKDQLRRLLQMDFEDAEDDAPPPQMAAVIEEDVTSPDDTEPVSYTLVEPIMKASRPEAVPYSMSYDIPLLSPRPHPGSTPVDDDEVSNLEAGADSTKRSYLSIIPTTIQVITDKTSLFVWHATFHPALNRRFAGVLISVRFSSKPLHGNAAARAIANRTTTPPSIQAYVPRKSFGATTAEQRKIQWGLELPITVPTGPVSLGVTPSGQRETSKEVQHAFTITGSARGTPSRNTCVWTVEENASSQRGIPSELQVAALVQHSGPLIMEVDISGKTAGGFYPSHNLRPKTDAIGRRKDIDPSKFKGLLFEYEFEGKSGGGGGGGGAADRLAACKKMLEGWTGKVDGAILDFDQDIASA